MKIVKDDSERKIDKGLEIDQCKTTHDNQIKQWIHSIEKLNMQTLTYNSGAVYIYIYLKKEENTFHGKIKLSYMMFVRDAHKMPYTWPVHK